MNIKLKFNPYKRCPICGKLLKKFTYDFGEWIYQCRPCNYMIRYHYPFIDLSVKNFQDKITIIIEKRVAKGRKPSRNTESWLKFGQEIKKIHLKKVLQKKLKSLNI